MVIVTIENVAAPTPWQVTHIRTHTPSTNTSAKNLHPFFYFFALIAPINLYDFCQSKGDCS